MPGRTVIVARAEADRLEERLRAEGFAVYFADLAHPDIPADARMVVLVWDRALLEDRSAAQQLGLTLESGAALFNLLPDEVDLPPLPLAFADFRSGSVDDLVSFLKASDRAVQPRAAVTSRLPAPRPGVSRQAGTIIGVALFAALAVIVWQGTRDVSAPTAVAVPADTEPAPPPPPPPPPPSPEPNAPPDEAGEPAPGAPSVPMPARPPAPVAAPEPIPESPRPAAEPAPAPVEQSAVPVWGIALGAALAGGLIAFALIVLTRRRPSQEASPRPLTAFANAPPLAPNFISYNMGDRPKVSAFVSEVEKDGTRCWMFDRDQAAAAQWAGEIVRALRQSDRVIVFLTPRSCASPHVCRELTLADRFRKPIVPVMLEPCEPPDDVVYFLASLHELRVFEVGEENARRLLREQVMIH